MIGKSITAAVALGLLMSLPAQAGTVYPNLLERIEREGTFKTFVKAVGAADGVTDPIKLRGQALEGLLLS
jgi:hypothetical protein